MIDVKEFKEYAKDIRVLYVEDNETVRTTTLRLLKTLFNHVDSAENGVAGLARYKKNDYDIVISDIHMPEMNGVEMVNAIKQENPEQSIIVTSAHDDSGNLIELINAGIEHFVSKPIDIQNLLSMLAKEVRLINFKMIEETYKSQLEKTVKTLTLRTRELESINAVIKLGATATSVKDLSGKILETLVSLFTFDGGLFFVTNTEGRELSLVAALGLNTETLETLTNETGFEAFQHFSATGTHTILQNCTTLYPRVAALTGVAYLASFPLTHYNEIVGGVTLFQFSERALEEAHIASVKTIASETAIVIRKMRAEELLQAYTQRIERNLKEKVESIKTAQQMQTGLNPQTLPAIPTVNVSALYMPSEELGGDFFDIRHENNAIAIVIADCVGHGIKASMDATLLKAISDRYIDLLLKGDVSSFIAHINKETVRYFYGENYPTMFSCHFDIATKTLTYANANSPSPYLVREGKVQRIPPAKGFNLGFEEDMVFQEESMTLAPYDILVLYSDALIEIDTDGNGTLLPEETIRKMLTAFGKGIATDFNTLLASLAEHRALPLEDDTTLIGIDITPPTHVQEEVSSANAALETLHSFSGMLCRYGYSEGERAIAFDAAGSLLHYEGREESVTYSLSFHASASELSLTIQASEALAVAHLLQTLAEPVDFVSAIEERTRFVHAAKWLFLCHGGDIASDETSIRLRMPRRTPKPSFIYFNEKEVHKNVTTGTPSITWQNDLSAETVSTIADDVRIVFPQNAFVTAQGLFTLAEVAAICEQQKTLMHLVVKDATLRELLKAYTAPFKENVTFTPHHPAP